MKLWGGRFGKATDGLVDDFHSSISFDRRLYEQDILGSIAHATMLGEQGIIPGRTQIRSWKASGASWRTPAREKSSGWWTRRIST